MCKLSYDHLVPIYGHAGDCDLVSHYHCILSVAHSFLLWAPVLPQAFQWHLLLSNPGSLCLSHLNACVIANDSCAQCYCF